MLGLTRNILKTKQELEQTLKELNAEMASAVANRPYEVNSVDFHYWQNFVTDLQDDIDYIKVLIQQAK